MEHNPQLEDGYTRIADEYLEALIAADYPASVLRFVLAVVRETWGWGRSEASIPVSRFEELLEVKRTRVYQLRDQALRHNLIEVQLGGGPEAAIYSIQKRYTDWLLWNSTKKWDRPDRGGQYDTVQTGVDGSVQTGVDGNRPDRGGPSIESLERNDVTTPCALELEMEQQPDPQPASYRVRLQRRMASLDETNRTALEAYFDLAATVEDSGAKSDQSKVSRFDELEDLRARFGDDAWRHGLREGVRLGKPFTNYVMAIMRNYRPGSEYDRGNGAPRQSAIEEEQRRLDAGRAANRELWEEDEERERQAAAERAAKEAATQ